MLPLSMPLSVAISEQPTPNQLLIVTSTNCGSFPWTGILPVTSNRSCFITCDLPAGGHDFPCLVYTTVTLMPFPHMTALDHQPHRGQTVQSTQPRI